MWELNRILVNNNALKKEPKGQFRNILGQMKIDTQLTKTGGISQKQYSEGLIDAFLCKGMISNKETTITPQGNKQTKNTFIPSRRKEI